MEAAATPGRNIRGRPFAGDKDGTIRGLHVRALPLCRENAAPGPAAAGRPQRTGRPCIDAARGL
ncbi:hypothetical protein NY78_1625 [Desulfovibrio sp. TomC]|nr:hypothetical protein NY78_1625 [Desulfovibrio sp. TomC]